MNTEPPGWMSKSLSTARLRRYMRAADGDATTAVQLYRWNLDVCSAFYGPLHWLEIGLRNALHDQLHARYESAQWWVFAPLNGHGTGKVHEARNKLKKRKNRDIDANDIVAKLTFGFWVSLLSRGTNYDRNLWVPTLHKAFPHYSGPRRQLHAELDDMLYFRNRIMHYEPIFDLDLAARRNTIYRQLGHLSPTLAERVRELDRIPEVLIRPDERG